jgi:hypothetical protein|tara:strand:+ start:92 stop:301 length:210 start_codon:yes stop_codon:yes gene_type:complete
MKVMKFKNTFVRVTEKKAAELYLEGWVYASKSEWKRHNKTLNKNDHSNLNRKRKFNLSAKIQNRHQKKI